VRQHVAIEWVQSGIVDVGDEHAFPQVVEHDHARAAPEAPEGFLVQLGPDARTGTEGQEACRFAAAAKRHHEQSGASVFSALGLAGHRALAVIDLGLFSRRGDNHRARLRWLVSAQLADEAFDRLIAAAERMFGLQVLPDRHRVATTAQPQFDCLTERFAETRGRNGPGIFCFRDAPLHAKPGGHLIGRFCGFCFCFSLIRKVFGVGVDRDDRFGHVGAGGHLVGRFCRWSPSPPTRRPHCDPGCLQIGTGGFSTHPGLLLDAPQRPSQLSQGYNLLSFLFAQDVAHADEGYGAHVGINVPSLILVGRFSGDHHWPVSGDR
jgi:hypothetical protein